MRGGFAIIMKCQPLFPLVGLFLDASRSQIRQARPFRQPQTARLRYFVRIYRKAGALDCRMVPRLLSWHRRHRPCLKGLAEFPVHLLRVAAAVIPILEGFPPDRWPRKVPLNDHRLSSCSTNLVWSLPDTNDTAPSVFMRRHREPRNRKIARVSLTLYWTGW